MEKTSNQGTRDSTREELARPSIPHTEAQGRAGPPGYDGVRIITQVLHVSSTLVMRGRYTIADWIASVGEPYWFVSSRQESELGIPRVTVINAMTSEVLGGFCPC